MTCELDHLVIAAHSLEAGVQWCEQTPGLTPDAGGQHPQMGTHNRLLNISSPAFAQAYLEIIAIDPQANLQLAADQRRWFDLDDPSLQARLEREGAALIHFVARTSALATHIHALAQAPLHIDRGEAVDMYRDSEQGRLHWQISIRPDGQRLFHGALPTLIQRDSPSHPTDRLPDRGLALRAVQVQAPDAAPLATALQRLGLSAIPALAGPAGLVAQLDTPRGPVTLHSQRR